MILLVNFMSNYGLFISGSKDSNWLREDDRSIAIWKSREEAEKWRKNHTVAPQKYEVKKVTPKIIKKDIEEMNES